MILKLLISVGNDSNKHKIMIMNMYSVLNILSKHSRTRSWELNPNSQVMEFIQLFHPYQRP